MSQNTEKPYHNCANINTQSHVESAPSTPHIWGKYIYYYGH